MRPVATGSPDSLGVIPAADGVNVAVFSAHASAIEFCVFGAAEQRFVLPGRTGDIFHGHIPGIAEGARYGLRAHGDWAPALGHRFNPAKLLLDPYALALDRPLRLDPSMFARTDDGGMDDADSAAAMAKAVVTRPELAALGTSLTPWSRSVIYEAHIRGFTMRHPDIPPELRGTFAGLAHSAAIAHLVGLGVTAIEILPPCAWIEERHLAERGLGNYWGYNTVGFLAPDPRLAPGGWAEVRAAVAALAQAGIETIVDIVFNHTGEGDDRGPTLSLRGLDNASYFRASASARDPWTDANDSGCGNTLALDRPAPLRLAMDSLRAWARFGGVHGFRFDLATVLGRRDIGFDEAAPLLQAIEQDPLLSQLKMIAEPWDCGWGGYQLGRFPARWGEWNDRFRDDIRRFWRGEPHLLGALATRLAGSADVFAPRRAPSRSVNFVTAHDGFTLADLVAYTAKRNDANGEDNRDGTNDNLSWNNGVEGPSDDPAIRAARLADQRALLATLLLARGTPMLAMGSEFGQSQGGNNNPYAQDNETSWLDWAQADPDLLDWTRQLLAIRRDHAGFRDDAFLTGAPASGPDVAWTRADGAELSHDDWHAAQGAVLVMQLCPSGATRVALVLNRGHHDVDVTLAANDGFAWSVLADSATGGDLLVAAPRSVLVLAETPSPSPTRRTNPAALALLAQAAGLAGEWWETGGTHHRVSDQSSRAILKAMQLPADSTGEARDSQARLAEMRDLRPLPQVLVRRVGENVALPMALAPNLSPRSEWLCVALEDGGTQRVRAGAAGAVIRQGMAADGRATRHWLLDLPSLPMGRHRIWREDAPDAVCHLTIAPPTCYLPDALRRGERRFGVSAQLYTVRTERDQGIGDFATLRDLALATRAAGGAVLGLNPMHALFNAQRERASPYQPSDRRFLDPIYLDLPEAIGPASRALAALPSVNYPAVWALKAPLLERRFAADAQNPACAAFIAAGGDMLRRFAIFQAIAELHPGQPWQNWPAALRHPDSPAVAQFARAHDMRVAFHAYLQFLCEQQLARAAVPHEEGGLEIGFIRDLAVGCAPDGAEAWAMAERVGQGVSIGAPPDPFAAEGQVWGLPPPNPHLMGSDGYAAFADMLAANMRHAGGLRIDHALGLARLFWVPEGARGAEGTYVAYPFADLLGQIALESMRARALVIGEDLGTVPDGLREALTAQDILSYRVLLLEREGRGFKPPSSYPRRAVACVSTHDLPSFAGWQDGADIAERLAIGLRTTEEANAETVEREAEIEALRQAVGPGALDAAAHRFVAETSCDLVYVQADDLAGERQAVNLPGTDRERPNWRRRLGVSLERLFDNDIATPILDDLRDLRGVTQ